MSLQTLKLDLEARQGRELLPGFFPIELLISLTRELGHVVTRSMSSLELNGMYEMLSSYVRRLVEMHGVDALATFDAKNELLTPRLLQELYECLTDEIIARLIGYSVSLTTLRERFAGVLENVEESV